MGAPLHLIPSCTVKGLPAFSAGGDKRGRIAELIDNAMNPAECDGGG